LSVWLVASSVIAMGLVVDTVAVRLVAGGMLVLWAGYHWVYGHSHRVRVGMTVGMAGLAVWSFLMATAHGAGLMLAPAVLPLCGTMPIGGAALRLSLAAVALHTIATLTVTGLVAVIVFEWFGVGFLRRAWINFDLLWTGALAATGLVLIVTA
jgi:hypothetical protein